MLYIYEVHFNHNPSNTSDNAINIRQNHIKNSYIKAPEWIKGVSAKSAAYAIKEVNGGKVTVKARFAGAPGYKNLKIRAVDEFNKPPNIESLWDNISWRALRFSRSVAEAFLPSPVYLDRTGMNILGSVQEKTIQFDSNGFSKLEEFELQGHKLDTSTGIGIFSTSWIWQCYENGKWVDFSKTNHRIYTVLYTGQGSWSQDVSSNPDNIQLPWVDALEVACSVASGAKNNTEIMKKITEWINEHPLLVYHSNNNFVAKGATTWPQFDAAKYMLSLFMDELKGSKVFGVNCLDCANAIIAFSNLLGADSVEVRFWVFDETRPIVAIGGDESKHSEWKHYKWGWHAIAFADYYENPNYTRGDILRALYIYDATLKIDLDLKDSDTIHRPHQPIQMKFGTGKLNEKDYVNYLLKDAKTQWPHNSFPVAREVR